MTTDTPKRPRRTPAAATPDLESDPLVGPPPLLDGDDAAAYWTLRRRLGDAVAPQDVIEEMFTRDAVDILWESLRLRRLKAKYLEAAKVDGLASLLRSLGMSPNLARDWALNDPDAVAEVDALLAQAGFDGETITAQTFIDKLDAIDRVDRMIAQQEARRVALLREIDRRRAVLAERLRAAAAPIDGEFAEIAPAKGGAA